LDDPVDKRNIETSGSHVRTQQDAAFGIRELEERLGSLGLLLLAVNAHHRQVDVVEQLVVVFHRHARAEEHHNFLLAVLFQEREEQEESLLRWHYHITLLYYIYSLVIITHLYSMIIQLHTCSSPSTVASSLWSSIPI
jgi:hypothetical protein